MTASPFIPEEGNPLAVCVPLNDGNLMPLFGLGVYQARRGDETYLAVLSALRRGYRHIDTAEIYRNEVDVGRAVREFMAESGICREKLWVTTKLWPTGRGRLAVLKALDEALVRLGLEYVDLYLIHAPTDRENRVAQWMALEELQRAGKIRSIGVSNYGIHHLQELFSSGATVRPAVNQIELSPYLSRTELVKFCEASGVVLEAYSPLTKAAKLSDPSLVSLADRYHASPAQILIQWCLQQGFVAIPKSVNPGRISENADVISSIFAGRKISDADMLFMRSWEEGLVTGWDPVSGP